MDKLSKLTIIKGLSLSLLLLILYGCDFKMEGAKENKPLIEHTALSKEIQEIYKKIQENNKQKLTELQQKSDTGNIDASKIVGLIYLEGKYAKKDISRAIEEFKKAADSGDKEAASILYRIYTSKKYKETHSAEAQEYGEIAGIFPAKKISNSNIIGKLKKEIEKNQWEEFKINNNERVSGTGSAVAINRVGYFLTNRHVVDDCRRVVVRYNNMFGRAISVSMGQDADVAVIKINGVTPAYQQFVRSKAGLGEKIYVGGYPLTDILGSDLKITDGLISGISSKRPNMIQITASISSGNSGGPVVDEKNRIVAIATSGIAGGSYKDGEVGHGINFATHSEAILKFLQTNQIPYETKESTTSISSRDVAEFLKISTGLVICIE